MKRGRSVGILYTLSAAALLLVLLYVWADSPKAPVPLTFRLTAAVSSSSAVAAPPESSVTKPASPSAGVSSYPPPAEYEKEYADTPPAIADVSSRGTASAPASSEADASFSEEEEAPLPQENEFAAVINLNTATKAELMSLDGIGPVLAQRILDFREAAGGFQTIEDLLSVKGIGEKVLANIRSHVCL